MEKLIQLPARPTKLTKNQRYYRKKSKDPAWKKQHNEKCRKAMQGRYDPDAYQRNKERERKLDRGSLYHQQLSMRVISLAQLKRPALRFIDPTGRALAEDYRSARELLEDFLKKKKETDQMKRIAKLPHRPRPQETPPSTSSTARWRPP